MMLCGKNPVLERLRANPSSIKNLYLQKRTDLSAIVREAKSKKISFNSVEKEMLLKLVGTAHSQGVVAEIEDFQYAHFDKLIKDSLKGDIIIVFLDGITDPQNLGSIIRTLACLGGFSLIIPKFQSANINETVLRVANGGENYMDIAMVANIATTLNKTRDMGIKIAGASLNSEQNIYELSVAHPLALVIGSEGKGIRPGVAKNLDIDFFIPMRGAPLSFNAAISTAIVATEITRKFNQRQGH